jgi:hypothetical protein
MDQCLIKVLATDYTDSHRLFNTSAKIREISGKEIFICGDYFGLGLDTQKRYSTIALATTFVNVLLGMKFQYQPRSTNQQQQIKNIESAVCHLDF